MADIYGHVGVRVVDDSGEVTSMPVYFKTVDTTTLATAKTAAVAVVDAIGNTSLGQVTKAVMVFELSGFTSTSPVANSRIESTGLLKALISDGFVRNVGIDIPALNPTQLLTGTKIIDLTATEMAALVTILENAAGTFRYTSPSGDVINQISYGRQTFRKHRRVANRH